MGYNNASIAIGNSHRSYAALCFRYWETDKHQ